MEITCRRCHHTIEEGARFCPGCGLPQLLYAADGGEERAEAELGADGARDASSITWSKAIKACLILALPAGALASSASPLGSLGFLIAAIAAAWSVSLYQRFERQAWVTAGAGLRIGLVTGLMVAWLSFAVSGGALFVHRYALQQGGAIDQEWNSRVEASQQMTQQWVNGGSPAEVAQAQAVRDQVHAFMLSPEGHAGIEGLGLAVNGFFLVCFASGGGALGARWGARMRRTEL